MLLGIVHVYAVLVAAIVAMIVGSLWYSRFLFGPQWMRLRGIDPVLAKDTGFPASKLILEFVYTLVTAFVLGLFASFLPPTVYASVVFALFIWVGFYVPMLLAEVLWENKPFGMFLINSGLRLVNLIAMILVLALWPR